MGNRDLGRLGSECNGMHYVTFPISKKYVGEKAEHLQFKKSNCTD